MPFASTRATNATRPSAKRETTTPPRWCALQRWTKTYSGAIPRRTRPSLAASTACCPTTGHSPRLTYWPRWKRWSLVGHGASIRRMDLKHHAAMQAIFFAFYNFCRRHETLKGNTPAMASGLTDKMWSVKELLERAAEV